MGFEITLYTLAQTKHETPGCGFLTPDCAGEWGTTDPVSPLGKALAEARERQKANQGWLFPFPSLPFLLIHIHGCTSMFQKDSFSIVLPFFLHTTCPCLVHNNNVRTCSHTHTHMFTFRALKCFFWIPTSSLVLPAQARATRGLQSCRRGTLEARGKDSSGWGHCTDLDSAQNTSHQRRK